MRKEVKEHKKEKVSKKKSVGKEDKESEEKECSTCQVRSVVTEVGVGEAVLAMAPLISWTIHFQWLCSEPTWVPW